jgi:hypothetical protein
LAAAALALVCLASWSVYSVVSGLGSTTTPKNPVEPLVKSDEPPAHQSPPAVDPPKILPAPKFPLELDFPGRKRGTSRFVFEPGSRSYLLTTEQDTVQLLQFGEMSGGDCTVEMEMSQVLPWSSLIGFFFGYREETRNDQKKWAAFDAVFLDENRSPAKPSGLRLSHWGMSANPAY